jgi:hypothetical protein
LLSYPAIFAYDRGHIFSLTANSLLIASLLRTEEKGRVDRLTLLLLACAINLRPNFVIFPVIYFLAGRHWRFWDGVALAVLSSVLFALLMGLAHLLYPAYSPSSWWDGLAVYSKGYLGGYGQAYGSSLFGALRSTPLGNKGVMWSTIVAEVVLLATVLTARRQRLAAAELMFLVSAMMAIGGQVFADYHLLAFLAPLVLVIKDWHGSSSQRLIFVTCLFVLVPKNYLFLPTNIAWVSWQVFANPIALLAGAGAVLWLARRREAKAEPSARVITTKGLSAPA